VVWPSIDEFRGRLLSEVVRLRAARNDGLDAPTSE